MKIKHMEIKGQPFHCGFTYGAEFKAQIHAFIDDDLAKINRLLDQPVALTTLAEIVAGYGDIIKSQIPCMHEEIQGLAKGAELSYEKALVLQLRRELVGYSSFRIGDCTTIARVNHQEALVAQTVDLNGHLDNEMHVLQLHSDAESARNDVLLFTYTGLLGYLGLNSRGVAVGINLVLGGDWQVGIPAYMALRHMLNYAHSAAHAVELLEKLNLASSRSFTIVDQETAINVEILNNRILKTEGKTSIHTNHYLQSAFLERDEINIFAKNGSKKRLKTAQAELSRIPLGASTSDYMAMLSREPIFVPRSDNIRAETTIARVVMDIAHKQMQIRGMDSNVDNIFDLRTSTNISSGTTGFVP